MASSETSPTAREAAHDVLRALEGDDGWTCACLYGGPDVDHIPICDRVTAVFEARDASAASRLEVAREALEHLDNATARRPGDTGITVSAEVINGFARQTLAALAAPATKGETSDEG